MFSLPCWKSKPAEQPINRRDRFKTAIREAVNAALDGALTDWALIRDLALDLHAEGRS